MKLNRGLCALCCVGTLLLGGCSSQSGLMIGYTDMNMLRSSDVWDAMHIYTVEPFAKNIAILENGDFGNESIYNDSIDTEIENPDNNIDTTNINTSENEILSDTPALVINRTTNEVVYANDAFTEVAPASLTKLMTALLALKYGVMTDRVVMTAEMNSNMIPAAQVCGFIAGDSITLDTLLRAMLVYSGNDAANAVGIHISGSLSEFVNLMNVEANRIGAVNTHFSNANGLDVDNHYSSAYDLYLMFNECMKYDVFKEAMQTYKLRIDYTGYDGEARYAYYDSTNLYLLGQALSPDGITVYGGKTGTTALAGACLITYSKDTAGNEYIAVSLGNENKTELYSQMNKLLRKVLN